MVTTQHNRYEESTDVKGHGYYGESPIKGSEREKKNKTKKKKKKKKKTRISNCYGTMKKVTLKADPKIEAMFKATGTVKTAN